MLGTYGTSNSSQRGGASGVSCRRTRSLTLGGIFLRVHPLARGDERRVHRLVRDHRSVRTPRGPRGLQEVLVVAIGELRLVVRPPALVAHQRPDGDDPGELE